MKEEPNYHDFFEELKAMFPEINTAAFYMMPIRCVLCPSGDKIIANQETFEGCLEDLRTWALPIDNRMINQ